METEFTGARLSIAGTYCIVFDGTDSIFLGREEAIKMVNDINEVIKQMPVNTTTKGDRQ